MIDIVKEKQVLDFNGNRNRRTSSRSSKKSWNRDEPIKTTRGVYFSTVLRRKSRRNTNSTNNSL